MDKWQTIWSKDKSIEGEITLRKLLLADGFDCGAGKVATADWVEYLKIIYKKLGLCPGYSLFEVGCGAGAFLYYFYSNGHRVAGLDYAAPLINIAEQAMKDMCFVHASAVDLNTKEKYDAVVSFGVFHYFPDLRYAETVIKKMLEKSNKVVAILDLPDIELKKKTEEARRGFLPEGEYERLYRDLPHLYYSRDWFPDFAKMHACHLEIFDQEINGYGNSQFRFNVVMKK